MRISGLVVYLSLALWLDAAMIGFVLSADPLVAAITGVPAGRLVDRVGAQHINFVRLVGMAIGSVFPTPPRFCYLFYSTQTDSFNFLPGLNLLISTSIGEQQNFI